MGKKARAGHWWHIWALLHAAPVGFLLIFVAALHFGLNPLGDWGCSTDRPLIFERDRWKADEIAAWALEQADRDEYCADLPPQFAPFAACGHISFWGDAIFVPQWAGIPDDAGGFWYSPGESPHGFDMWGMECKSPIDLGGGWWECGMR